MVEWCARAHVRAVSTRTVAHPLTARPLRPARQLGARTCPLFAPVWLGGRWSGGWGVKRDATRP